MLKAAFLLLFEGIIYITFAGAVAHGNKLLTAVVIAYFFLWQAVHRRKIKDLQQNFEKYLEMQLKHNNQMLKIGKEGLNGKK